MLAPVCPLNSFFHHTPLLWTNMWGNYDLVLSYQLVPFWFDKKICVTALVYHCSLLQINWPPCCLTQWQVAHSWVQFSSFQFGSNDVRECVQGLLSWNYKRVVFRELSSKLAWKHYKSISYAAFILARHLPHCCMNNACHFMITALGGPRCFGL